MNNGYIKLHRKFTDWEWYSNINVKTLFIHCLLKANFKPKKYQGIQIDRGQFMTSINKLHIETGLSERQVRSALDKLILTNELTNKSNNKYRIITVKRYNDYQTIDNQLDKQMTDKRQTSDNQVTTTNKEKKEKNDNKEKKKEPYFSNPDLNNLFNDFLKQRKSPKVKNTERSINLLLGKLEPFSDEIKIQMINNSIVSGWTSVFEIKTQHVKGYQKNVIPNDIKGDFLTEEYQENLFNEKIITMKDQSDYAKQHDIHINNVPEDSIILKWKESRR